MTSCERVLGLLLGLMILACGRSGEAATGLVSHRISTIALTPSAPGAIACSTPTTGDGVERIPSLLALRDQAIHRSMSPREMVTPSEAGSLPFGAGVVTPLSSASYGVATGDWNEDGLLDVASAGGQLGLGDGTGHFAMSDHAELAVWWPITADFNRDGHADLAGIVAGASAHIQVMLGHGNGTFDSPSTVSVSPDFWALAAADLDSDGSLDLVVSNVESNTISVWLGAENGWMAPTLYPAGPGPAGLCIADFDRDDHPDIAVCHAYCNSIAVYFNLGDGRFDTRLEFLAGWATSIAAGDLDGNGWPDLVETGGYYSNSSGVLWNEEGLFTRLDGYWNRDNSYPGSVAIGDLDQDGLQDFVVVSYHSSQAESWAELFVQRPDHTFDNSLAYFTALSEGGVPYGSVTLADVDGVRGLDILVSHVGRPNWSVHHLLVIPHRRGLGFSGILDCRLPATRPDVQAIQFRRGGAGEILVNDLDHTSRIRFREDGTPLAPENFVEGAGAQAVDVDRDGLTDLLTVSNDQVTLRRCGEDGQLELARTYPTGGTYVALGDFDGDSRADLLIRDSDDTLAVMLDDGVGGWHPPIRTNVASPAFFGATRSIGVGRIDGDARSDLLLQRFAYESQVEGGPFDPYPNDSIVILRCESVTTFSRLGQVPMASCPYESHCTTRLERILCADVNGDGLEDIVGLSKISGLSGLVSVVLNHGDAGFSEPQGNQVPEEDPVYLMRDFTGDGSPDVAAVCYEGTGFGRLWVRANHGDGTFDPTPYWSWITVRNYPRSVTSVDLDGDGKDEMVVGFNGYSSPAGIHVLFNRAVDFPVPTLFAFLRSEVVTGRVRLAWYSSDASIGTARIERRRDRENWQEIGSIRRDGLGRLEFEDVTTEAGRRYAYRLVVGEGVSRRYSESVEVQVPEARLALQGISPNPATGPVVARFSLSSSLSATLELVDIMGRRVQRQSIEESVAGPHQVVLDLTASISPGIYWLRLSQGGRSTSAKLVIAR